MGIVLLKLKPSGVFQFDWYTKELKAGTHADPSIGGRRTCSAENDVIYFVKNPNRDLNHNSTLNFNDTKAKFKNASSNNISIEKAIPELEFFESGIFWINGIELKQRN